MNESGGSGGAATGPTGRAAPLIALIRRWRVLISAAFPHVDPVRSRSIPLEMGQLETTWSPQFRFHPFVYLAICARLFPITPPFFSISNCFGIFRDFYGFIEDLTRSSADSFLFSRANLPRLSSTTLPTLPHTPLTLHFSPSNAAFSADSSQGFYSSNIRVFVGSSWWWIWIIISNWSQQVKTECRERKWQRCFDELRRAFAKRHSCGLRC